MITLFSHPLFLNILNETDGNMKQWWENETIIEFQKRAQCMIDQYSSYVLEEVGLNINGKMTNGEVEN